MIEKHTRKILWGMIVLGFLIRVILSWQSPSFIIQKFAGDDLFYILKLVENIIHGFGISFDGMTMTNGFHPLYIILLLPLAKLFPGFLLPLSLTLLALFDVLTAFFIFKIVRLFADEKAALFGAFLWLFNPFPLFIVLHGVEAAISTFFIAITVYCYLKNGRKRIFLLSLFTALAIWSRTDSVFMFVAIALHLFLFKKSVAKTALYTILTLVIISPFFIWSYFQFGTVFQDSYNSIAYHQYQHFTDLYQESIPSLTFLWQLLKQMFSAFVTVFSMFGAYTYIFTLFLIGFLIGKNIIELKLFKKLSFTLVPLLIIPVFYPLRQLGWLQRWYFLSSYMILTFWLAVMFGKFVKNWKPLFVGFSILFVITGSYMLFRGLNAHQQEFLDGAQWIQENTPQHAIIGGYNSGITAYYSNRTFINLDGVMNNEMYPILKNKKLLQYIKERNIQYIADFDASIHDYRIYAENEEEYYASLHKVYEAKGVGWASSHFTVYKIDFTIDLKHQEKNTR